MTMAPRSKSRSKTPTKETTKKSKSPKSGPKSTSTGSKSTSHLQTSTDTTDSSRRTVFLFYGIACVFLLGIVYWFQNVFPPISTVSQCQEIADGGGLLWIIRNARDEAKLGEALKCAEAYRGQHQEYLVYGFVLLYFTMQSFVIPGTGVLSVLSGALFPFWQAELLVALCACSGATVSFLFSRFIGEAFLVYFNLRGEKLEGFREKVVNTAHEGPQKLFAFMVMLRSTPVPNLLINVGSPHVGVPVFTFALSTLFGLVPLNTCHILSGYTLSTVGTLDKGPLTVVGSVGAVILVGVLVYYLRQRQKAQQGEAAAKDKKTK